VLKATRYFAFLTKKLFNQRKAFCHPIVQPKNKPAGKKDVERKISAYIKKKKVA